MKHIHKTIFVTDDYYTSQYFSDGFVFLILKQPVFHRKLLLSI